MTDFMTLCSPGLRFSGGTEPSSLSNVDIQIEWESDVSGATLRHRVDVVSTGSGEEQPAHLSRRLACYFLVDQMPDEGVPESLATMIDLYKFYYKRAIGSPPCLPRVERATARLADERMRAPFEIDEG